MLRVYWRHLWCRVVLAAALSAVAYLAADANDSAPFVRDAEQYLAKGDARSAEIELRNAVRESPDDPVIRARLAQVYLQLGNAVSAEAEARVARERNGNEADYLPVLANALLQQGKFADLPQLIRPGDRAPALESKIRLALGIAAAAVQDRERAGTLLRDAVRLDPSAAAAKIALARFLTASDPRQGEQLIDEAIAIHPRSPESLQVKGEILRALGDPGGAMRLFDQAVKIDPKNLLAHLSRADLNIAQGKFASADLDIDPILKLNPDNFAANYLRASELAKQQRFVAADQIFDRISYAFTTFPEGYYLQGTTKLALGQFAKAESILGEYLRQAPSDPKAVRLIARAALSQHAAARAIDYLKSIADQQPADAATLSELGNAYMADGKPELALQQFEKAAALAPSDPTIRTRVAISEIDTGNREMGLAQLEQVFRGEGGVTAAGPTLVLTELRAGRVDKAAEVAAALIKQDANNDLYQTLQGEVRAAQKDYTGAEAMFRAALAHNPEFSAAARNLAQLYLAMGRTADAKKVYTDLLAINANDAEHQVSKNENDVTALIGLADIAIAEKKWPEATDALNRARSAAQFDPTPGLKLVSLFESRHDWNAAKALTAELTEQFPRDARVFAALGKAQIEAGDTVGAIATYKLAYHLAPESAQIRTPYVALLNRAKYFRDARDVLQDAVAREPRNRSLKLELIRVRAEADGLDTALFEARRFAKDDPDTNAYDLVSAELYEKAGKAAAAVALLEKAIASRPADNELAMALSGLYARMGDFAKAQAILAGRLQSDPKSPDLGSALASLYLTTGRQAEAEEIYSGILSRRPSDVPTLLALARIAIAKMKWPEATEYLARARAVAPSDPAPGLLLLKMYASRRDWKDGAVAAAALAAQFPENPDVFDTEGRIQIAAGDTGGAISSYKRVYELAPNSPRALSDYLAVLGAAKHFTAAWSVLQTAIERDPHDASLKGELIRVEAQTGSLDAALAMARNFARTDPGNSLYDVVSAELYEKAGRTARAVDLLESAIAARPLDNGLTAALSHLYSRMGEPAKAEAILNTRLAANPKDFAVRSALALFYLEQQRYADAITQYSHLIADHPADPVALNNLAWLYQRQGDLAKARQLAEQASAIFPRPAHIDDTLGWILLAQGNAERALTHIGAAYSAAPDNTDVQYHLAVALRRVGRAADARSVLEKLLGSGASFADRADAEKLLAELKRG